MIPRLAAVLVSATLTLSGVGPCLVMAAGSSHACCRPEMTTSVGEDCPMPVRGPGWTASHETMACCSASAESPRQADVTAPASTSLSPLADLQLATYAQTPVSLAVAISATPPGPSTSRHVLLSVYLI